MNAADDRPEVILGGAKATRAGGEPDARFWLVDPSGNPEKPAAVHDKVHDWAVRLKACWRRMAQLDREHDIIYENRALRRGGRWHAAVAALTAVRDFDSSRLFVTTSIIDTFHARMVKRSPMPAFVVDDAEYSLKNKAHDFRAWLHGKLRSDAAEVSRIAVKRDAPIRGDGIEYIDDGDDDVIIERAHRSEWLADPYEARHGADAVRTLYRFRTVSRDSLTARFPQFRSQIESAPNAPERSEDRHVSDWLATESELGSRDVVDFIEAWHLGSPGEEQCSGRVARVINGVTLCYDEWEPERFPIARLTWHAPTVGLWGHGDVERLRGIQGEINGMCRDLAMNIAVTGKGIWITPPGIQPAQLVGYRPFHIEMPAGASGRTEFHHPQVFSPSQLELIERFVTKMHDLTGAAQWFAQGRSPLGNDVSGVALDTMEDALSDRHAVREHNVSRYVVARSHAILDAGRRVSRRLADGKGRDGQARKKMVAATWMDKGSLRRLDFDDVSLDAEQYEIGIEPISSIPTTKGGKYKWVSEMIAKGVIPSSQAPLLYDEPDIAHANRILLGALKNCERKMEEIGDPVRYPELPTPEEWHDLPLMLEYTKAYFNRAQAERPKAGASDEAMALADQIETRYREFGDAVIELQKKATPPTAPPVDPAMGGMGDPLGLSPPMPPAVPPMLGADPMAAAPTPMMPPGI